MSRVVSVTKLLPASSVGSWHNLCLMALLKLEAILFQFYARPQRDNIIENPVKIVCISDTHNCTPALPEGDILIHAGDLSHHGSFAEIQAQLDWLRTQPHAHKVVIAGNHDLLMDAAFVDRHPERVVEKLGASAADLNWNGLIQLNNSSISISVNDHRTIKFYGSPLTPQCGNWAFQYPPIRDVWKALDIPLDIDVLVTHRPPKGHLDDGIGCEFLLAKLRRLRVGLHVFGHVHGARGRQVVGFDVVQNAHDDILCGHGGFGCLVKMGLGLLMQAIAGLIRKDVVSGSRPCILVNAAMDREAMDDPSSVVCVEI
jgi:calcineurin-like phosphoesterase family protein